MKQLPSMIKNKSQRNMLNRSGSKINPCGTPEKISSCRLWAVPFFVLCGFEDSYALSSKLEVIGHKNLISWQIQSNIFDKSVKTVLLSTACFYFSSIKRRQCWVLKSLRKPHWNFERIFSKYDNSWLLITFSKILKAICKTLTGL